MRSKHKVWWKTSLFCGSGPESSSQSFPKHCWIQSGMLAWRVIASEWDGSVMARIWRAVFILTAQPQIGKDPSRDELLMLSCPGLRLWFWCSGQRKWGKTTCMSSRAETGTIFSLYEYWINLQMFLWKAESLFFPLLLQCYQMQGHDSRLWYVWPKPSNQT